MQTPTIHVRWLGCEKSEPKSSLNLDFFLTFCFVYSTDVNRIPTWTHKYCHKKIIINVLYHLSKKLSDQLDNCHEKIHSALKRKHQPLYLWQIRFSWSSWDLLLSKKGFLDKGSVGFGGDRGWRREEDSGDAAVHILPEVSHSFSMLSVRPGRVKRSPSDEINRSEAWAIWV